MLTIRAQYLAEHTAEVLHQVKEGETIEVTEDDEPVARLIPAPGPEPAQDNGEAWISLEDLRAEISKHWPKGVSAVDAVRDVRRDL